MTASSFPAALSFVLSHEGRCYTCDPRDPGGATMWGIDLDTFRTWSGNPAATPEALRAMTPAVVASYYRHLWATVACDSLLAGVDFAFFDAHVNTGLNAGRQLQRIAGLVGPACDGRIGPITLAAVARLDAQAVGLRLKAGGLRVFQAAHGLVPDAILGPLTHAAMKGRLPSVLIAAMLDQAETYYRSRPAFPTYGNGWLARAYGRAEAGLKLATGST